MTTCAVTTLIGNDKYLWGGICCAYSYKILCKGKYDFIMLTNENCSEESKNILKNLDFIIYKEIKNKTFTQNETDDNWMYATTRGKIEIFNLTNYRKVLFVDADCLFRRGDYYHPDELLDILLFGGNKQKYYSHIFLGKINNNKIGIEGHAMVITPSEMSYEVIEAHCKKYMEDITCMATDENIFDDTWINCSSNYDNMTLLLDYELRIFNEAISKTNLSKEELNYYLERLGGLCIAHKLLRPKYWIKLNIDSLEKVKNLLKDIDSINKIDKLYL